MRAMILAAGRGERLRPLTDTIPKPLLYAGKKRLIEYHLENLARANITEVVINVCYKVEEIVQTLSDGKKYGVNITYSVEQPKALDTGGGILNALPLLGNEPFLVMSSDIWTDYSLTKILAKAQEISNFLAHLILVPNPQHHQAGDFGLSENLVTLTEPKFTYANIGIYSPLLFENCNEKIFSLASLLRSAIAQQKISGELYQGQWTDAGTAARLNDLKKYLWNIR